MPKWMTFLVRWCLLLPLVLVCLPEEVRRVWMLHVGLMLDMSALLALRVNPVQGRWFTVQRWEMRLYDLLGVRAFHRLLEVTGWNSVIRRWRRTSDLQQVPQEGYAPDQPGRANSDAQDGTAKLRTTGVLGQSPPSAVLRSHRLRLTVRSLERHTQQSELTHWAGVVLAAGGALQSIWVANPVNCRAHLLLLVFLHLYPIALQRQLRFRLLRLRRFA